MNTRAQSQIWFLQSHINALVVSPKHALKSNHVHCEWGQRSLQSLSAEHYLSSIKLWNQSCAAFFHWHLFDLDADSLINKTSTFCHHQSEGSHFASQPVLLMLIWERGCANLFFFLTWSLIFYTVIHAIFNEDVFHLLIFFISLGFSVIKIIFLRSYS